MPLNVILYWFIIPAALLFVPWFITRYVFVTPKSKVPYMKYGPLLWLIAVLWICSFILPNVPVTLESDSITMHAMGGIVAGLLALYFTKSYGIEFAYWWQPLLMFYFFASGLGVANEIMEFTINNTGLAYVKNGDVCWDLLANTVGVSLVTIIWYVRRWVIEGKSSRRATTHL